MGRAILVVSIIVLCSFIFVLLQLWQRAPAGVVPAPAGGAPVLEMRDDGSVYAVSLRLKRLEERLMEAEKRAVDLEQSLTSARTERDELKGQVNRLEGEVSRLQRRLEEASPQSVLPPANAPTEVTPPTEPPVTPTLPGPMPPTTPTPGQ